MDLALGVQLKIARTQFFSTARPLSEDKFSFFLSQGLTALSNMPESRVVNVEGSSKTRYEFMETPKMSTYLLAFIIGEFDFVQGMTKNGTLVRCLSVPGKADQLTFSLDVGVRCLDWYNEFFGIPYPLPKMDMIAIPDFAAGAMENWGLVTYREIDLLCDTAKVSTVRKQRVASVVTHELAHQWFGNLVTMEWWNDLWLNEGFANFMQTYSANALFPEWSIWETFVSDDQSAALRLDSLRSSHPIQVPIPKAEDVEEIFDAISYCKGREDVVGRVVREDGGVELEKWGGRGGIEVLVPVIIMSFWRRCSTNIDNFHFVRVQDGVLVETSSTIIVSRRLRRAHDLRLHRRRQVPRGPAAVHEPAQLRQHADLRSVEGVGGGVRAAHRRPHEGLDGADGLSGVVGVEKGSPNALRAAKVVSGRRLVPAGR